MLYIRTTKTSSGAKAVQVIRYVNRRKIIAAHIGSAHNSRELLLLKQTALAWIRQTNKQLSLLPPKTKHSDSLISLDKCQYLGIRYSFIYEVLTKLFALFKFHLLQNPLLTDLVLIRIVEPGSKLRSLELLEEYFGIKHQRRDLYRQIPKIAALKEQVEIKVLNVAKKYLAFDFSLLFYDVTTLYFESFGEDEFRKLGFSKDNKVNQPQILIGLMVNTNGFPVAYEIFKGNKFEGHTLIPVIAAFRKRHQIKQLTVVADAAMISLDNVQALQANGLYYIIGARIGNLPLTLIRNISRRLNQTDNASWRFKTKQGELICSFSQARFHKDKHEMKRQIQKAKSALKNQIIIKRMKFLKNTDRTHYQFNFDLVSKTKLLLGIKGYYTNLPSMVSDSTIIGHYHNLWRIEQTLRIAKSDLKIRPIYHFKKQAIQAHILICFMALAISKYLEIETGKSIKFLVKTLKSVTDAIIFDNLTQKEIILRSKTGDNIRELLKQLRLWY